jgi:GNAT superfamily N-acetyltransferase
LPFELARLAPGGADGFFARNEREALKTFYAFSVIWHEQTHDIAVTDTGEMVGAIRVRIAASLAHVDRIVVAPGSRRNGIGRMLLADAADIANYYNCHKMTTLAPHRSVAQRFFEACGYKEEAVLAQHTFKLDMAVLRLFLL